MRTGGGGHMLTVYLREQVSAEDHQWFQRAVGSVNWLVTTLRYDCALAVNRISQHTAHATVGSLSAIVYLIEYLWATKDLCLRVLVDAVYDGPEYSFYVDSEHGGDRVRESRLCATASYACFHGDTLFAWRSGRTEMAFATSLIGQAHADTSSAAAETYAAGVATQSILGLSYVADELNMTMALPMELRLDATAALAFMTSTATRSKMRHIDLRSEWVAILRDKQVFAGRYCPSEALFADLGTKIQGPQKFGPLRDGMYYQHKLPVTDSGGTDDSAGEVGDRVNTSASVALVGSDTVSQGAAPDLRITTVARSNGGCHFEKAQRNQVRFTLPP
jgi:hypothetical protein